MDQTLLLACVQATGIAAIMAKCKLVALELQQATASIVLITFTLCRSNSVANILDIATSAFLARIKPKVELQPELAVTSAIVAVVVAFAVSVVFPTPALFCTKLRTSVHTLAEVLDVRAVVDKFLLLFDDKSMAMAMLLLSELRATVMHNKHAITQATSKCTHWNLHQYCQLLYQIEIELQSVQGLYNQTQSQWVSIRVQDQVVDSPCHRMWALLDRPKASRVGHPLVLQWVL